MDPFLKYLIAVNVVTFFAFVIDFLLCMWKPEIDDMTANSLIMDVFPIAGGAVGMLLAMFILTGLARGHRMNKDNIAWWFLAIVCLIVWGFVVAARFGFVQLDASIGGILAGWNLDRLKILGIYLGVINAITFAAFTWDKFVAANGNDWAKRIPEAYLLALSLIGGSVGGLLAMNLVRHKTKKWYFVWGLPVFIALNIGTLLYAHVCALI
ncbi:MAG: DUF1294 domain-containing protein [Eggerthellaceae bacterium]|nr:DUF1294 domain-containing protein [Eggerthellaceae bacterium]MBR1828328.1 DUF1294 domain-containing protein [Atopobiaceae bacterium]